MTSNKGYNSVSGSGEFYFARILLACKSALTQPSTSILSELRSNTSRCPTPILAEQQPSFHTRAETNAEPNRNTCAANHDIQPQISRTAAAIEPDRRSFHAGFVWDRNAA